MTEYECYSLSVGVFQAIASLAVGALAVFLPWIHRRLWHTPKLELSINNEPFGRCVKWAGGGGSGRYHHIRVKNASQSTAQNVAIYCIGIELPKANGEFQYHLIPRVRFFWPHQEDKIKLGLPLNMIETNRNIQSEDLCDLCHVSKDATGIYLSLDFFPSPISEALNTGSHIRLHVKAIGDNCESKKSLVVELAWNKKWSESDEEMSRNLVVKAISNH